jgi:Tol biopolymer transport system component/DNA-binding winged helix-turn-helix (wHTH) protein
MRFGTFEVDFTAGELRRYGRRIALQEQPFQILCALLERPGELVTREQIRQRLWPSDVHVDFERGLNKAVLKLREAIGDSAENPRFIETVPRKGYRFIAPVTSSSAEGAAPSGMSDRESAVVGPGLRWRVAGVGVGAAVLGGALVAWLGRPAAPRSPVVRFTVSLPPGLGFNVYNSASVVFSHDGTRVAYSARGHEGSGIYVRPLDGLDLVRLPGTEEARSLFFSSDDSWIGFEAGEKLKRVGVTGGTPQVLGDLPFPAGATAGTPDDSIILVPSFTGGLFRLPHGGRPLRLTTPDSARGEGAHVWPQALPQGRGVLYTVWSAGSFDQARIAVLPLPEGEPRVVIEGGYSARYSPSGHLVFVRGGGLHAAPFDLDRLAVIGPAVSVVPGVLTDTSSGAALFDVSPAGALAYVPGTAYTQRRQLMWVDRTGHARAVSDRSGPYLSPRLSPDGRRIALWVEEGQAEVWIHEPSRGALTRTTLSGDNHSPMWSPDGTRLAFESGRRFVHQVFIRPADGAGEDRQVTEGEHHHYLSDWSRDGRWLAYTEFHPATGADVWVTSADGTPDARPFARAAASEKEAVFSPDGRWLAYVSDESGQFEVYVQPFPGPGSRRQVSTNGGAEPAWSTKGDELFYRNGRQMVAVTVTRSPDLEFGRPTVLFEGWYHDNIAPCRSYDVTADGRFLMVTEPVGNDLPKELHVVLGWADELGRRVPRP